MKKEENLNVLDIISAIIDLAFLVVIIVAAVRVANYSGLDLIALKTNGTIHGPVAAIIQAICKEIGLILSAPFMS